MIDKYLAPMEQLEVDYPDVMFVYMTGHLTYWSIENCNARNQQIRDWCIEKNKILFDFAHIESFDPDRTFFPYANDDCDYWNAAGSKQGNWAVEWQNAHVEGIDWYQCSSAHSQPLNANQKAYAIWWLWARLAGWEGPTTEPLTSCTHEIPASTGWSIRFDLRAGTANAGRTYLLLGTASGTSPGYPLPGGMATLPLNWDPLTDAVLAHLNTDLFQDFYGTLSGEGERCALIHCGPLPGSAIGVNMHFAYALNNRFDFVSNALPITVVD
jgi:hypothetical protein